MSELPPTNIVSRLMHSLDDLEQAIQGARQSLAKKQDIPKSILSRLDSYEGILATQRRLTSELGEHVKSGNTIELARRVTLINGLSVMIIEDARQILSAVSGQSAVEVTEDLNIC